jgi:hypothetical protein
MSINNATGFKKTSRKSKWSHFPRVQSIHSKLNKDELEIMLHYGSTQ